MDPPDRRTRLLRTAGTAVFAAVFTAVLAAQALAIGTTWGAAYWWPGCVFGAIVGVLALARRVHLACSATAGVAVAAVAVPVARLADLPREPNPATALALAVLTGAAVRTLPVRIASAIAAGGFAVVAASWLAGQPSSGAVSSVVMVNLVAWLTALLAGLGLRLSDAQRAGALDKVRRDERLDLARELHDVVAHHVTGIVVLAQGARVTADGNPLAGTLEGIETAGSEALAAMRRVVGLLRDDDAVASTIGPERLGDLVARFGSRGPVVRARLPEGEPGWAPEVAATVHRVVQESLTNVTRHAPLAGSVSVRVEEDPDAVTVEVTDDAPPAPVRNGLVGARDRPRAGAAMTITVMLADDQAMVRAGLRLILENEPDVSVVAEAVAGVDAVEVARRLRPDVCLVDIRMPRLDGIEVTRALAGPGVPEPLRVVVVTTFDLDEYVYGALRGGAAGFVLKDAGPALLVEAVRAAHAGDALVSPSVTVRLLRRLTEASAPRSGALARPLSARETEVVRAIARGRTNQEVAAELFISLSTVKSHLTGIHAKLGTRNRVEVAAWAWENRVVGA